MDEQEAESDRSQVDPKEESKQGPAVEDSSDTTATEDERDPQEGQAGDALSWIEGPDFDSPIEEMPTLQWPDVEAEASKAEEGNDVGDGVPVSGANEDPAPEQDELEDAMQWLEELAKEQGTPIDEMPTLISGESDEELLAKAAAARGLAELGDTTPPPQLDSDPMAWLEQLAIDQDSPLEELPSVADRLLASEIASQSPMDGEEELAPLASQPLELDEALKYLEEQAAAEGIALDDVTFDEAEVVDEGEEGLDALDKLVTTAAAAAAVKGLTDSPADEDDADALAETPVDEPDEPADELAWLGELAEEEPTEAAPEAEGNVIAAAGTAAIAEELTGEEEENGVMEEAVEPEPAEDEGGAPLKKAAATAGAAKVAKSVVEERQEVDEIAEPAAEDVPVDRETSDGMHEAEAGGPELDEDEESAPLKKAAATAGAAKVAKSVVEERQEVDEVVEPAAEDVPIDRETLEGMPDDPDEAMAWMGALGEEEDLGLEEGAIEQQAAAIAVDEKEEDKDGSLLKKGLAAVSAAQIAKSFMGDKEEADEPEQESEDEVLDQEILEGMPDDPDEAMVWMAGLAAQEMAAEQSPAENDVPEVLEEPAVEMKEAGDAPPAEAFNKARAALAAGNVTEATKQYREMLDGGQGGKELIGELETAAAGDPQDSELQQVLGDAYMQDGQMQKAMEAYNRGFDQS